MKWETLLSQYANHKAETEDNAATELRLSFIRLLREDLDLLEEEAVAHFLAAEVKATDFQKLNWQETEEILEFCNQLYIYPFEDQAVRQQVREHVRRLLRYALRRYEEKADYEQLFKAVRIAPLYAVWNDEDLTRLRHLAYHYEVKRVTRNQRWLYAYLAVQAVLVTVVFPILFINAENGALQAQVEQMAGVEIGDEGYHLLSYMDALYWSVITAASIGYGDITPTTTTGRIIAAVLGTIGVITIGIIAGLILNWITPRRID
ncbi:MAG: potassium channel family protein [Caldilineaceae bacterium]